jgi:pyrroline-5-carboxylate reductase
MLHASRMAFVGSGVMGEAMIKGLLTQNLTTADCIVASDPWQERLEFIQATYGVSVTNDNAAAVREAEIVVLSIKPQSRCPRSAKTCTARFTPMRWY